MINEEIVNALLQHYGLERTIHFCEMQAMYFKYLAIDFSKNNHNEPNEYVFQKDWFAEKAIVLQNKLNIINNGKSQVSITQPPQFY